MKPIDADELLDKIVNIPSKVTEKTFYDKQTDLLTGSAYRQNEIIDIVNAMPTVEQKHGHWIKTVYSGYKCEICGHIEDVVDEFELLLYEDFADFCENNRYCRICGAKMQD